MPFLFFDSSLRLLLTRAVAFVCTVLLGACASAPPDRGLADVQALAKLRGLQASVPSPADPASSQTIADASARLLASPLRASDAVQLAFLNQPRIAAEYGRLGLSSAEVVTAGRLSNPVLSASWQRDSRSGASSRYDFGLTQNFIDLLMLPTRSRIAAGEFERARLAATQALLDLAAEVQRDYIMAVGARQIAALRDSIAEAAETGAELGQRQQQAGNLAAFELAVMQASASEARLDAEQAHASMTLADAALNQTMGLPADTHWQLAGTLPAPVTEEDDPATLRKLAQMSRADLEADRRAEALLGDALDTTRALRFFGDFDAGVDYERDTDRSRLLGPSFSLQLPLFNQGQDAVLRARSRVDLAHAARRARAIEIDNAVDAAYARTQAARQRITRLRTQTLPLREAIVARTQERMNYALVGVFELLRVRQDEYAAYQSYLEAVRDYSLARVDLARAVGTRLPSDGGAIAAAALPDDLPAVDSLSPHAAQAAAVSNGVQP